MQRMADAKDMSNQKVQELKGSVGLAMASIRELTTEFRTMKVQIEVKKALIVLMETT